MLLLSFPFSFPRLDVFLDFFLGERCREGDDVFLGAYIVLVPLSGGLVIDVEVCHVEAEIAGIKLAGFLDPFARRTLNVVKEILAAGLDDLLEAKGKLALLVEFYAVLAESVDLIPLLLYLCQVVTHIISRLSKGELLDLPLLGPVFNDELRLDGAYCHIQEGQLTHDFASGYLVGADRLILTGV